MEIKTQQLFFGLCIACVFFASFYSYVRATSTDEVDILQDELNARKAQIDQINDRIDEYRARIKEYSNQSVSLANDIAMIENQVVLAKLDIEYTQAEIDTQELEIRITEEAIKGKEEKIQRQVLVLRELLFELNKEDGIGLIEVLFSADNFNELFARFDDLQTVNDDLKNTLNATKDTRDQLILEKADQENRIETLVILGKTLEKQVQNFEYQIGAKETLIAKTRQSESEYRALMSELRQEQQLITNQVVALQSELEGKLADIDDSGSATLISWPLHGIITAVYHDPTYPFRNLFEHSGLDIAVTSGTPIYAAAPGYVAWSRTGNSYGNYVMIIHANGYATLYAHMSSFVVSQEDFVSRGQVIGYSGNTGFSTGPHLHFEVRINGIPVDPQLYLP